VKKETVHERDGIVECVVTSFALGRSLCYHFGVNWTDLQSSICPPFTVVKTMDPLFGIDGGMWVVDDFPSAEISDDPHLIPYDGDDHCNKTSASYRKSQKVDEREVGCN
jgi:hypothetical protein